MVWERKVDFVKSCGHINKEFKVLLKQKVVNKIKYLMKKFNRLEWLGYLVGELDREKSYSIIEDMIIPKQNVTSVTVNNIECDYSIPTIGVIHSHHHMSNHFSGTDHNFINLNNDISLLVTHKEITGQIRYKTRCDCYFLCPVTIEYDNFEYIDEDFIRLVDENIKTSHFPLHQNNLLIQKKNNGLNGWDSENIEQLFFEEEKDVEEDEDIIYVDDDGNELIDDDGEPISDVYTQMVKNKKNSLWPTDYFDKDN